MEEGDMNTTIISEILGIKDELESTGIKVKIDGKLESMSNLDLLDIYYSVRKEYEKAFTYVKEYVDIHTTIVGNYRPVLRHDFMSELIRKKSNKN